MSEELEDPEASRWRLLVPDVIGIGMINLDYIVDSKSLTSPEQLASMPRLSNFEYGVERRATREDIDAALSHFQNTKIIHAPGGSAFNVISSIASTQAPVSVGYVGSCGYSPNDEFDFESWLSLLGIDSTYIYQEQDSVGVCISYSYKGERSMLTWSGANDRLEAHLIEDAEKILAYLSSAKIVHVNSYRVVMDHPELAYLLKTLKARYPAVTISCDPGHVWVQPDRPKSVDEILGVSDVIFLNGREFDILTRRFPNMSDRDAARLAFNTFAGLQSLIVLKRYDSIKVYYKVGPEVVERTFSNSQLVSIDKIVDDTGAGDVFAAGFFIGTLNRGFDLADSIELGLSLARVKLEYHGMVGAAALSQAFSTFASELARATNARAALTSSRRVFIGHGQDAQWLEVKDFLAKRGLRPAYFEAESNAGHFVSEVLTDQALAAQFAVIVVTGDDIDNKGSKRGRQNVIHEIGLMQGRLGWGRVAILLEEGVEIFSNMSGLQFIQFTKGRIRQAFLELEEMLLREGMPVGSL